MDRTAAGYGRGEHAIDSVEAAALLGASRDVVAQLRALFEGPDYRPPTLPSVALQVHELTKRPDVDLAEVVGLLETDALIAAEVLRLAQTPAYATRVAPQSLDDVVRRLGLDAVQRLVWEVAAGKVFRVPAYQPAMERLRAHAVAVARLSHLVSSFTSIGSDQAFLCGLLHDVGWVAALLAVAEDAHARRATPAAIADIVAELDAVHGEAGGTVARLWSLPADVALVLEHHHRLEIDGFVHPLSAVVAVANDLATEVDQGLDLTGDGLVDQVDVPLLGLAHDALGLDDHKLAAIRAAASPPSPR